LPQDEILGLQPRSPREQRPDSKQQLDQKRDHRPLHYHNAHPHVTPDRVFGRHNLADSGSQRRTRHPRPIPFKPDCDKITRMHAQSARIEAGQVHLPRQERWLEDFRAELLQFPNGKHDDQFTASPSSSTGSNSVPTTVG